MLFIYIKKRDPKSLILDYWKFYFFDASTLERHAVTMYIIGANRETKEPNPNVAAPMWPLLLTWFNFNPSMDK